jgi:hypothetical protein
MDFYQPGVRGIRASTRHRQFRSQLAGILAHFGRDVKSDFLKSVFNPHRFCGFINARENCRHHSRALCFFTACE